METKEMEPRTDTPNITPKPKKKFSKTLITLIVLACIAAVAVIYSNITRKGEEGGLGSLGMFIPKIPVGGNEVLIADFNTGEKPNNIGGDFGSWDKDPYDDTQTCTMEFSSDDALGDTDGQSIRLEYDVESDSPAYNGFWMKLAGMDATPYNTLSFYIKGSKDAGYPSRVKIELKDMSGKPSGTMVANVTDEWQKVSIPFSRFRQVKDWSSMNEFVVVFDDYNSRPKTGAIYIDQITFEKGEETE